MRYIDCTLTIEDLNNVTIEYPDRGKTYVERGSLSADAFAYLTIERLNYWVNFALRMQEDNARNKQEVMKDLMKDLQVIGLNLYGILFSGDNVKDHFGKTYQAFDKEYRQAKAALPPNVTPELRMRLRLVFQKPAEKLATLPWEFLFIPGEGGDLKRGFFFAGQKTELILTRYVPESEWLNATGAMPKSERMRILVVVSSPSTLGRVDEKETQALLSQIESIPQVDVKKLLNPTYEQLSAAIDADEPPHILHFIGHGKPGALALVMGPNDPEYEESMGDDPPKWVTGEQFRYLFNTHKPRLVFLHACKGATADSSEGLISTARELVYAEIPAVVAMQYSISNQDAGRFARKFYEELGKGREIDEAVKAGRMELGKVFPPWEHPRFGTPVVYLQTESPIVLATEPAQTADTTRSGEGAKRTAPAGSRVGASAVGAA